MRLPRVDAPSASQGALAVDAPHTARKQQHDHRAATREPESNTSQQAPSTKIVKLQREGQDCQDYQEESRRKWIKCPPWVLHTQWTFNPLLRGIPKISQSQFSHRQYSEESAAYSQTREIRIRDAVRCPWHQTLAMGAQHTARERQPRQLGSVPRTRIPHTAESYDSPIIE